MGMGDEGIFNDGGDSRERGGWGGDGRKEGEMGSRWEEEVGYKVADVMCWFSVSNIIAREFAGYIIGYFADRVKAALVMNRDLA